MRNILVTGANGQLGNEMRIVTKDSADKFVFTDVVDASEESIAMLKNQLYPSSFGISPLATSHQSTSPGTPVRSSSKYYLTFNLLMARSLGFGSIASY